MPNSLQPHGLYSPWNSPGQNTGVGSLSLLQGIFPTLGLNPGLPHCEWILYQLSHKGSSRILEWVAYPFSSRSSWPRASKPGPPALQVDSLPTELSGSPNFEGKGKEVTRYRVFLHSKNLQPCLRTRLIYLKGLYACMLSHFNHIQLFVTLWTRAYQASLSTGFFRQEYWSGLPCPAPGDLPDPGMEPASLTSPSLAGRFFTTSAAWETQILYQKGEKNADNS